ncbi:MAG: NAD(P)-dependent oxidoreductase [Opitutales bacterium]|nr:NAD(P)-dependent oxidoreductase [Opitutales bacterium]
MKILITGGLGFIGRTLVEALLPQTDCAIHILDIKDLPVEMKKERITFHKIDICDRGKILDLCEKERFDGVVHLAAVSRVEDGELNKELCVKVNYQGTKNVCEGCNKNPNAWIISASSREVYGEVSPECFPVKEDIELCPINNYGHTKLEGELLVQSLCKNYIIMRFSNVYGNNYDRPERVIPKFVRRALAGEPLILQGGEQVIDFTFIDDAIRTVFKGIKYLAEQKNTQECIHVTPGRKNALKDVAVMILKLTGSDSKIEVRPEEKRVYDVVQFVGDVQNRKRILGEDEFLTIEDGLKKYIGVK